MEPGDLTDTDTDVGLAGLVRALLDRHESWLAVAGCSLGPWQSLTR